jgi:nucleotide-binding universal stress UspA family protein
MLPISRILFPVDFSDRCADMLPYVKIIAARYGAEITLLHVINPVVGIPNIGISPPELLPESGWLMSQQAERLECFGKDQLDGLPVRTLVYEGEPEAQIVATAVAEKSQLVIMATHGHGRIRRFLIGSTTCKVLHDLHCPVLTGAHLKMPSDQAVPKIKNIALCNRFGADELRGADLGIASGLRFPRLLKCCSRAASFRPASQNCVLFRLEGRNGSATPARYRETSECSWGNQHNCVYRGGRCCALSFFLRKVSSR